MSKAAGKSLCTAVIALSVVIGANAANAATTIYGEFTADNNMVLAYGADGLPTQIQSASGNPNDWRTTTRYKFDINSRYLSRRSCTVQVVAWGDGHVAEGLIGFLQGDYVAHTGSNFTSRDTGQAAGGAPSAGMLDTWRNQPHASPAVGGPLASAPWTSNSFNFSGNISNSRWIWTQANFQNTGTGKNYRSFKIPCSKLVRTDHGQSATSSRPAPRALSPQRADRLVPPKYSTY